MNDEAIKSVMKSLDRISKELEIIKNAVSTRLNFSHLVVTLPDGSVINKKKEYEIYIEAIKFIGTEECAIVLGPSSITRTRPAIIKEHAKVGEYYIKKHLAVKTMRNNLKRCCERLGVNLEIELIPRTY